MGVWSRELVRRVFKWHYSRGPERTTFFSPFFLFISLIWLVSLVFVCVPAARAGRGGGERERAICTYI